MNRITCNFSYVFFFNFTALQLIILFFYDNFISYIDYQIVSYYNINIESNKIKYSIQHRENYVRV